MHKLNKMLERLDTIEFLLCCDMLIDGEREILEAERNKLLIKFSEALINEYN